MSNDDLRKKVLDYLRANGRCSQATLEDALGSLTQGHALAASGTAVGAILGFASKIGEDSFRAYNISTVLQSLVDEGLVKREMKDTKYEYWVP